MATPNSFINPSMHFLALFIISCFAVKRLQALESQAHALVPDSVHKPHPIGPRDSQPTKSIPSKLNETNFMETNQILTLPVQSGKNFGTDKYTVTFGVVSPYQELSLPFNTVSNLIWTRCNPYIPTLRQDLYFKPSNSTTYYSIACNSPICTNFLSNSHKCNSNNTCIYSSKYDDQSVSDGVFSLDRLNMTGETSDFLFFCVPYNPPRFSDSPNAGLLGLGRGDLSLASQLGLMYNKYFSYCLPSSSTSTGYLTFGQNNSADSSNVKFTSLFPSKIYPSFYFIRIVSIAVGGHSLQIEYDSPVFQDSGTMIDSGTFITRLPAVAYAPMRDAFVQLMKDVKMAPPYGILDTCYYNTTNQPIDDINIPAVSFTFDGNVTVDIDASGIYYAVDDTKVVCFAFANNTQPPSLSVFGNAQQKKIEVVYDVANEKLGFRPNACD